MRAVSAVLLTLTLLLSWAQAAKACGVVQRQACPCCDDERACNCCKVRPQAPLEQGVLQAAPALALAAGFAVPLPSDSLRDEDHASASPLELQGSHSPPIYLSISQFLI